MSTPRVQPHSYSDGVCGKRILIIGPYPPPLGGVSVHIKRVMHKLSMQHNRVRIFDNIDRYIRYGRLRYPFALLYALCMHRPQIIYYHTLYVGSCIAELSLMLALRFFMRYEIVLIEHDCRHIYNRSAYWLSFFNYIAARATQLVLIGNRTYESYQTQSMPLHNATVEEAFLPPALAEEASILATYPATLFTFLRTHTPIISMNAFQIMLLHNKDLYGLDISIALLKNLRATYPNLGLICGLASIGNHAYFNTLEENIERSGLANAVFFLHDQKELWPLIKRSDLFIRPTRSDGASVSICEALYFGVPATASDVCARPPGTLLFPVDNLELCIQRAHEALQRTEQSDDANTLKNKHHSMHTQQNQ